MMPILCSGLPQDTPGSFMSTMNMEMPLEPFWVGSVLAYTMAGFATAMKTLDGGRLGMAAQALGIAQGCLDESVKYARERKQFGRPIAKFQAVSFMIAHGDALGALLGGIGLGVHDGVVREGRAGDKGLAPVEDEMVPVLDGGGEGAPRVGARPRLGEGKHDKHQMLRKLYRQFAQDEFTDELLDRLEETGEFDRAIHDKMAGCGFMRVHAVGAHVHVDVSVPGVAAGPHRQPDLALQGHHIAHKLRYAGNGHHHVALVGLLELRQDAGHHHRGEPEGAAPAQADLQPADPVPRSGRRHFLCAQDQNGGPGNPITSMAPLSRHSSAARSISPSMASSLSHSKVVRR